MTIEEKSTQDWAQLFVGLDQIKIQWQPSWQQQTQFIYYYEKYPKVALIGTKCCINYNPTLAQRQFGYPLKGAPTPSALVALVFYYNEGSASKILHQVRSAWNDISYMERDSRSWVVNRNISYSQWIAERVKEIKLPFKVILPILVNDEHMVDLKSKNVK